MNAACLVCGGTAFDTVARYRAPDMYERAVGVGPDGYDRRWVRCAGCGFHASHYSRDPEFLDRLYLAAYRDESAGWRGGTTEEVFRRVIALPDGQSETRARVRWVKDAVADLSGAGLLPWGDEPRRMLDVGGATGVFAYEFQDSDWRGHVIDPAESGLFLERDHGIPYVRSPYRAGSFDRPFHLVSLVFALEHIRTPDTVLADVRADLAPGGLVYIEVPDAIAFSRLPHDDDIFNSCHLWMFDPASLMRVVARNGFEVTHFRRNRTFRGHHALCLIGQAS